MAQGPKKAIKTCARHLFEESVNIVAYLDKIWSKSHFLEEPVGYTPPPQLIGLSYLPALRILFYSIFQHVHFFSNCIQILSIRGVSDLSFSQFLIYQNTWTLRSYHSSSSERPSALLRGHWPALRVCSPSQWLNYFHDCTFIFSSQTTCFQIPN